MIFTEEVFEIEDCVQELCDKILASSVAKDHLNYRYLIASTPETQAKEQEFIKAREAYERVEPYGKFAPDYTEKRRKLRQEKRQLDMDENVSSFRISEWELQEVLDRISYDIAQKVSANIKIDAGNPFFEFATKGCGGNCHGG